MNKRTAEATGAAGIIAGIALIVLADAAGVSKARVFGAVLVVLGGATLGSGIGFERVPEDSFTRLIQQRGLVFSVVATLILVLPVVIALGSAAAGLGASSSRAWILVGLLIALLMLAGVLFCLFIAVRSMIGAVRRPLETSEASRLGEEAT